MKFSTRINKVKNMTVDFCNKKATLLNEMSQEYKDIKHCLLNNFRFREQNKTEILDLNAINQNFLVSINNKNKHSMLLFLIRINGWEYSILIDDTKNNLILYSVKFRFHHSLYTGTLFTTEMVKNEKKCWVLYISDLIYHKDHFFADRNLSEKIATIADILKTQYVFDTFMNVCHIQLKGYFLINQLPFITRSCELLFFPERFCNNYFSFKLIKQEEVIEVIEDGILKIFTVKKTKHADCFEIYDIKTTEFVNLLCISKIENSKRMRLLFEDITEKDLELRYSGKFNAWVHIF